MRGRKKRNFISFFAIQAPRLLRKGGTEQVRQIFEASTVLHTYAASDVHVRECFFCCSGKKVFTDFSELQHNSAMHSDEKEGVGNDGTFELCYDRHESLSFLSWSCPRK